MFAQGSVNVNPRFNDILRSFFPRYLAIINSDKYRDEIEEIRIEGHTSSEWEDGDTAEYAYFQNMQLSHGRTRAVLQICLGLIEETGDREWARRFITANGLSSSQLVFDDDNTENPKASRRVEFRTKTAAERRVVEIIRELES